MWEGVRCVERVEECGGRGKLWVGKGGCGWWEHVCASLVYRCSHMCIVCVFCVCVCVCARVCGYVCARVLCMCVLCGVNVCGERGGGVWKE